MAQVVAASLLPKDTTVEYYAIAPKKQAPAAAPPPVAPAPTPSEIPATPAESTQQPPQQNGEVEKGEPEQATEDEGVRMDVVTRMLCMIRPLELSPSCSRSDCGAREMLKMVQSVLYR